VLQKTGPCPKWYTLWRTRTFALKGNFLYYYKQNDKVANSIISSVISCPSWFILQILLFFLQRISDSIILGAVYIRGAALDYVTSMNRSKHVMTITPPVPRRPGWSNDETSVLYVKFSSEAEATEVSTIVIMHSGTSVTSFFPQWQKTLKEIANKQR